MVDSSSFRSTLRVTSEEIKVRHLQLDWWYLIISLSNYRSNWFVRIRSNIIGTSLGLSGRPYVRPFAPSPLTLHRPWSWNWTAESQPRCQRRRWENWRHCTRDGQANPHSGVLHSAELTAEMIRKYSLCTATTSHTFKCFLLLSASSHVISN